MTSEPALDVSGQDDNSSIGAKEEDEDDDDDEDLREDRYVLLSVNLSVHMSFSCHRLCTKEIWLRQGP